MIYDSFSVLRSIKISPSCWRYDCPHRVGPTFKTGVVDPFIFLYVDQESSWSAEGSDTKL